jgi:hypothetical protein
MRVRWHAGSDAGKRDTTLTPESTTFSVGRHRAQTARNRRKALAILEGKVRRSTPLDPHFDEGMVLRAVWAQFWINWPLVSSSMRIIARAHPSYLPPIRGSSSKPQVKLEEIARQSLAQILSPKVPIKVISTIPPHETREVCATATVAGIFIARYLKAFKPALGGVPFPTSLRTGYGKCSQCWSGSIGVASQPTGLALTNQKQSFQQEERF